MCASSVHPKNATVLYSAHTRHLATIATGGIPKCARSFLAFFDPLPLHTQIARTLVPPSKYILTKEVLDPNKLASLFHCYGLLLTYKLGHQLCNLCRKKRRKIDKPGFLLCQILYVVIHWILSQFGGSFSKHLCFIIVVTVSWLKWAGYLIVAGLDLLHLSTDKQNPLFCLGL